VDETGGRMPEETLAELRQRIIEERLYVDKRPYSHNIISLTLRQIDRVYGKEEVKKAIRELKLEKLGWSTD
jgi:hypothetical protein